MNNVDKFIILDEGNQIRTSFDTYQQAENDLQKGERIFYAIAFSQIELPQRIFEQIKLDIFHAPTLGAFLNDIRVSQSVWFKGSDFGISEQNKLAFLWLNKKNLNNLIKIKN